MLDREMDKIKKALALLADVDDSYFAMGECNEFRAARGSLHAFYQKKLGWIKEVRDAQRL